MNEVIRPVRSRQGFSLVELTIGLVMFSFGTLGLAAMTAGLQRQTTLTGLKTERNSALVSAVEQVRATDFDSLTAGTHANGAFTVSWSVQPMGRYVKTVQLVTVGPGVVVGSQGLHLDQALADTMDYQVIKP